MRKWLGGIVVVLSIGPLEQPSAAAPTLTPTSHDFGNSEIGLPRATVDQFIASGFPFVFKFRIGLAPNDGDPRALQLNITGISARDFSVDPDCHLTAAGQCDFAEVYFLPRTPGPKTATLEARINGQTASAALSGVGVTGKYSGQIAFQHTIIGTHGRNSYSADVLVVGERAFCSGNAVDVSEGGTQTTSLNGPGLFELRWNDGTTYSFEFACPNPSQNQPKAAWSEAISSYQQQGKTGDPLKGSWSEPAPETDEVNAVTGTIRMSWKLAKSGP
jgi:hypothetical protein